MAWLNSKECSEMMSDIDTLMDRVDFLGREVATIFSQVQDRSV